MSWCQMVEFSGAERVTPVGRAILVDLAGRAWRYFISAWLAVVLLVLLAVTAGLGTFLPAARPGTAEGLLERAFGLRDPYHSWWFCTLLGLLAASTLGCTLSRLRLSWRRVTATATHGGILLVFLGAAIGGLYGAEGQVRVRPGRAVTAFRDGAGRTLRLGFSLTLERTWTETEEHPRPVVLFTCAEHLRPQKVPIGDGRAEYAVPDTPYTIRILRRIREFSAESDVPDAVRRIEALQGPALLLEVCREGRPPDRRIHFARSPRIDVNRNAAADVSTAYLLEPVVKNYASRLRIRQTDGTSFAATVRVNDPLALGSTRIFQLDGEHAGPRGTVLKINRDPGLGLVHAGFVLLAAGVGVLFTPLCRKANKRSRPWKAD